MSWFILFIISNAVGQLEEEMEGNSGAEIDLWTSFKSLLT